MIHPTNRSIDVLIHREVLDSHALDIDDLVQRLVSAIARGLQRTSGSLLKTLRGPFGGCALRFRVGSRRVPFSWVSSGEQDLLVIHQIGERHAIYHSSDFRSRLRVFHEKLWDPIAKAFREDPSEAGYLERRTVPLDGPLVESPADWLEPWLTDDQAGILSALLPFPEAWKAQHAVLLIGKGAPGSGKTVVGAELAATAAGACGYDALVLVPTHRLRATYADLLSSGPGPNPDSTPETGRISVELVQEFFQDRAGNVIQETEREQKLRDWWNEAVSHPALNAWEKQHPTVRGARFLRLLDGLLEGSMDDVIGSRDALDVAESERYLRLKELRAKAPWMRLLRETQVRHGLTLRCQAAGQETDLLPEGSDRPLLIIVDECQDLVPAEWRALLKLVDQRRRGGEPTRIALLGDESQRITPTSFAWADVRNYALSDLRWTEEAVLDVTLPGSFRILRNVARAAIAVFAKPVCDMRGSRRPELLVPDQLPAGGHVSVLLGQPEDPQFKGIVERLRFGNPERRFIVLLPDDEGLDRVGLLAEISEILPVRAAKGLEFQGVLVLHSFGGGLPLRFDRAASAYTSMTRATTTLLCLIDHPTWHSIASAFEPLVDEVVDLHKPAELEAGFRHLHSLQESTPLEEQVAAVFARIDSLVDDARMAPSEAEREALLHEVLTETGRLITLGAIGRVTDELPQVLAEVPAFYELLSALIAGDKPGPPGVPKVISHILVGDVVGATSALERDELGLLQAMRPEILTHVMAAASEIQRGLLQASVIGARDLRAAIADLTEARFAEASGSSTDDSQADFSPRTSAAPATLQDIEAIRQFGCLEQMVALAISDPVPSTGRSRRKVRLEAAMNRIAALEDRVLELGALAERLP